MEIFYHPSSSTGGKMYGNVKTNKKNNPFRVITSACNTAVKDLSIFLENDLFELASESPSRLLPYIRGY